MNIAIIPARGGSRRIPRKNIRLFHGKPIIGYSIEAALASELFDDIVVSTEDDEIADVAKTYGASVLARDPALAADEVGTQAVIAAACRQLALNDYDGVCAIYPCAPLLTPRLLQHMMDMLHLRPCSYVVACYPNELRDAGAVYWGVAGAFVSFTPLISHATGIFPFHGAIDINDESDWTLAEKMFEETRSI